jgi:hypothetical protein
MDHQQPHRTCHNHRFVPTFSTAGGSLACVFARTERGPCKQFDMRDVTLYFLRSDAGGVFFVLVSCLNFLRLFRCGWILLSSNGGWMQAPDGSWVMYWTSSLPGSSPIVQCTGCVNGITRDGCPGGAAGTGPTFMYGVRFSTEICTRGCHWFPRLLRFKRTGVCPMAFLSGVHFAYQFSL